MIRFNEDKKANEIALIEIFKSIDGEGYHSGQVTVFIRTFGCNLSCSFCDTDYSLNEDKYKEVYKKDLLWMTAQEIYNTVNDLEKDFKYKSICLTGGEPLLEINKDFMLNELLPLFIDNRYAVNIETNGAIDYKPYKDKFRKPIILDNYGNRIGLSLIADYKLPYSKMNDKMIDNNLKLYNMCDIVKCVISDLDDDWKVFEEKVCKSGTNAKIYLSPVFGRVDMKKIPEFVISHPKYNITTQLQIHKFFWEPNKIGV